MKHFDFRDFSIEKLIEKKRSLNLSIGLALPVFNEAGTIVSTLKVADKLLKSCLIDEIIVVDSESEDGSDLLCSKFGVKYVRGEDVATKLKVKYVKGKGWNLWTSVYALKTDIIIWIDSDIRNIDDRFIVGLAGPMIMDNEIKFVKGYYNRPEGGGRVTEIMVRPFINMLFPKVQSFIQPLSGEYGGRRKFFEKMFFYSGYSVDIALLIQATELFSHNEIGQVYLEKRLHKNQDLSALSKMSVEIMHILFQIAQEQHKLKLFQEIGNTFRYFIPNDSGLFYENIYNLNDIKLPPLTSFKQNYS